MIGIEESGKFMLESLCIVGYVISPLSKDGSCVAQHLCVSLSLSDIPNTETQHQSTQRKDPSTKRIKHFHYSHHTLPPPLPNLLSNQPQLPIESFGTRFTTQKVLQSLHLLLTTTLLKNHMTIPTSLRLAHRILLKDAIEHIRAIDLRAQIAIITSVISANEMSKCGLTIAPVGF